MPPRWIAERADRFDASRPGPRTVRLAETLSSFPLPLQRALSKLHDHSARSERQDNTRFVLNRPNHKLQPAALEALMADYRAGSSIKGLGRNYNLHEQTVRAHLKRQHVQIRPAAALDDQLTPRIVEQYLAGMSLRELGREYQVAANSVRNRLLVSGVALRPPVRTKRQPASQ